MNALIATAKFSNLILAGLLKLFGPSIAPIAKEFGLGDGLSMLSMKAVYWPVWRVDALLEGRVEGKGKEREEGKSWVAIQEGYVPGMSSQIVADQATHLPRYHTSLSPFRLYLTIYQNRSIYNS